MTVEFVAFDAPYQIGERKECTPAEARKLIKSGVAREVAPLREPRRKVPGPGRTRARRG